MVKKSEEIGAEGLQIRLHAHMHANMDACAAPGLEQYSLRAFSSAMGKISKASASDAISVLF